MHEFKGGQLHSGSSKGPVVHSRQQAIAIAMSEARRARTSPHPGQSHHGHKQGHSYKGNTSRA
jgi:hypothetical protein